MPQTLELSIRRADTRPASWNAETRTIEATLSTGASVPRRDARGPYLERLDTAAIDPASLVGVVVLDGHRQTGSEHVVGTIAAARREGEALVATIRLSAADDVRSTVIKVEEGILRGVSVGYAVDRWAEGTDAQGRRTKTATAWRIAEASLVAIPADPSAHIRSDRMPELETPAAEPAQTPASAAAAQTPPVTETRAAIRTIARTAGLTVEWADSQIDAGADVTAARAAAFDAMVQRATPALNVQFVGPSGEDPAVQNERMAEALACRAMGTAPSDASRPFMALGMVDMARNLLVRSGVSVGMLSREEIIQRAMHTTSDFPNLLTETGNRMLMPAYQQAASPLKTIARQSTADDFRAKTLIKLGEFGQLEEITESGEITATTTGEAIEGYSLKTFARMFNLSRKAIVNDDLGAFGRWSMMMGRAAAETEAAQLMALLTQGSRAGPVMQEDNKRLFHTDHGNLSATTVAGGGDLLDIARKAMRKQKSLDNATPINATAKYLLVGPDQETDAQRTLAEVFPAGTPDANPFAGSLALLVDARITVNDWLFFADPAVLPVLEYAYLSSAQGPQMASRDGWDVLGREFRVVLDFGCGAVDWRGAYRIPGA